ncbi:MAG: 3,4-dihydroxy-2-butanone-4-phosphate synthase, partial [Pseudomonadota bacterium]
SVAISHQSGPSDITTPGHIFPVVAREGGVLTRAGHTEAAVDIARMAGLIPSGVICEIMGDDGEMARLDQLKIFAKQHHLNIGSIADLIAYRRRHDQLVECVSSRPVLIRGKMDFDLKIYRSHSPFGEHLALTKGVFKKKSEILVRMHALDILNDVLGGVIEGSEVNTIRQSLDAIEKQGCGALVLIREPSAISLSERVCGLDKTKDDQHKLSSSTILRNYGVGAQILIDLGIHKMKLLSNAKPTAIGLDGYGLEITGYQKLS